MAATTVRGKLPQFLEVGPAGFQVGQWVDRGLVLVQAVADEEGQERSLPVTQRGWEDPAKSQVVKFAGDAALATVHTDIDRRGRLVMTVPGKELVLDEEPVAGHPVSINIFGKTFIGIDQGNKAAEFGSAILGRPARMLRADEANPRIVPSMYQRAGASNRAAGHDSQALSLLNQGTLDHLLAQCGLERNAVPAEQYRMGVIVEGPDLAPYAEDFACAVEIGVLPAFVVNAVMRCIQTTIGQTTGIRGEFPGLRVLRPTLGRNNHGEPGVFLGVYLNPVLTNGPVTIHVGDKFKITSTAETRLHTLGKS